ncbi:hypothetical protein O9993_22400 [Vibrio lentus]|nr:hypothetical protein [Vibrio lentus]
MPSQNLKRWRAISAYADDKAIVGGMARLNGRPVMVIGLKVVRLKKVIRNFGMPKPEGITVRHFA